MVAFKNAFLFAATALALVAQPVSPDAGLVARDEGTILANLKKITTATQKLDADTKSWDGSLNGGITIQNDEAAVESATSAATKEVGTEGQKNSATSKAILKYVTGTLTPAIHSALHDVIAKKASFQKAGLAGVAHDDLVSLKSKADALSQALKKIASADQKTPAQNAQNVIDGYFKTAIAAFS